jgi:diadenosine tetraphosphate (Ap4A) HIT family hydrolase
MNKEISKSCYFCNIPISRRLGETLDFIVSLAVGPICEGHLLISPKDHSVSGLIDLLPNQLEEFIKIKSELYKLLTRIWDGCQFFEHGHHGYNLENIYHSHAHFHAVPINTNIFPLLEKYNFPQLATDYTNKVCIGGEYLFYQSSNGHAKFFRVNKEIENHFLRKLLLIKLEKPIHLANWELYPNYDVLERAKSRISANIKGDNIHGNINWIV